MSPLGFTTQQGDLTSHSPGWRTLVSLFETSLTRPALRPETRWSNNPAAIRCFSVSFIMEPSRVYACSGFHYWCHQSICCWTEDPLYIRQNHPRPSSYRRTSFPLEPDRDREREKHIIYRPVSRSLFDFLDKIGSYSANVSQFVTLFNPASLFWTFDCRPETAFILFWRLNKLQLLLLYMFILQKPGLSKIRIGPQNLASVGHYFTFLTKALLFHLKTSNCPTIDDNNSYDIPHFVCVFKFS